MRRVVILGGGAAGYAAAQVLIPGLRGRTDVTLSLIDERSHYVVRPLLSEIAAGALAPQFALSELARLVDFGLLRIVTERIEGIDPAGGEVRTERGVHPFDYLLIALDGESAVPPAWLGTSSPRRLETDIEATGLRNKLRQLWKEHPDEPPRVVIIGAGPVGVDLAAWLAGTEGERSEGAELRTAGCRVTLYEASDQPLPDFPDEFSQYARTALGELGVHLHCDTAVRDLTGEGVVVDDGAGEPAEVVIWAGGERPVAAIRELANRELDSRDLVCDRFLRLEGFPNIVVAGAHSTTVGAGTAPCNLAFEIKSGRLAALNLLASMDGRAPEPLKSTTPLVATPVGRGRAVAMVLGMVVRGRAAWPLYRFELARLLPRMSNRVSLLGAWASETLTGSKLFMPQ